MKYDFRILAIIVARLYPNQMSLIMARMSMERKISGKEVTHIEGHKFEGTLWPEIPILKPPLRAKILSILTPNISHPPHGIGQIIQTISLLHLVAIREDIILM